MTLALLLLAGVLEGSAHAAVDTVLYAADFTAVSGHWTRTAMSGAAGGSGLATPDQGWSQTSAPLASPTHAAEALFTADANTTYRVWLRLRAAGDSKFNESVWVQFSDAVDAAGAPLYRIGSQSALLVNLEACSGCGVSGWGWQDGAYWLQQVVLLRFATSGSHQVRIQTREDGVAVDQLVLSAGSYLNAPPGTRTNDTTIVPKPSGAPAPGGPTPYSGAPVTLPGTVRAALFDHGGEGISWHDTTAGNTGGALRGGDVDLESSTEGGHNVGWTAPGEWLKYGVTVATAGTYSAQVRVASPGGARLHLGFDGPSAASIEVQVPATGGWQNWTTVSVPVTLTAGAQSMRVLFDTGGVNLHRVDVASAATAAPYGGSAVTLPGLVDAERFDTGPDGVSYHDTTPGNAGGAFRSTGVDLEPASDGGFNVGWTEPGEWLNYAVHVGASGTYSARVKVASLSGGSLRIGFSGSSTGWVTVAVPATGGWQRWVTVPVPVTLTAGTQRLTVLFDTAGINLDSVSIAAPSTTPAPGGGTLVPVITWNIQINDSSEAHARLAMDLLVQHASPRPEVIVIQEAHQQHVATYIDELQKQTGRRWYGAFATHCAPGTWNGTGCNPSWYQGVGIFSTYEVVDSSALLMPYADCWTAARVALRAALSINGVVVQVFGTHLQSDSCGDMSAQRRQSLAKLKEWAARYPAPQLAAGDFNGPPSEINTTAGMLPDFIDTWSVGTGSALTAYGPSPTKKIDYWFVDDGGRAAAQSSDVIEATGPASDHFPVHATILIK